MRKYKIKNKYKNIYVFYRHRGFLYALKMVYRVIKEIDLFDLTRSLNTREITKKQMQNTQYMWYSPVYTNVCKEMISISSQFYNSAIKYSNNFDHKVFIDLGGGLGKPSMIACEEGTFSQIISADIDKELSEGAFNNFNKFPKYRIIKSITCNVERKGDMQVLFDVISKEYGNSYTLFVFNKNSYGSTVLRKSLELIKKYGPDNVLYLYQNPVHSAVLSSMGYRLVGTDDKPNNEHKNYKYHLYWWNS